MSHPVSLRLSMAVLTDPGLRRQSSEDAWSGPPSNLTPEQVATKGLLYIVADGGGRPGRGIASQMAVQIVQQLYYADPNPDVLASLEAAVQGANRHIYHGISQPEGFGMSTTLTAAVIRGGELFFANVGNSRAYLLRGGQAWQMTVDHTWAEERRRVGLLTDWEAACHPWRHIITRSLGDAPGVQVDVFGPYQLIPGDRILLCTDGLVEIDAREIAAIGGGSPSPALAARRFVNLARQRGGLDNITALLVFADGPRRALPAAPLIGIVIALALIIMGAALIRRLMSPDRPGSQRSTSLPPAPSPFPFSVSASLTPTPIPVSRADEHSLSG